ncbi:MAG: helix-turn-helix transcriptional regulator [Candidatus Pacebacteria bacterium]|nr:helix-turn-helix transcriptional regulator [Candidatus Paceibacterota bacterium]
MTNFEKHFKEELKNPEFRKESGKEYQKLRIAYEISQLRKKKKMSQDVLAKKIGSTQSAVARIEAGKQNLSLGTLSKIAEAFDSKVEISFAE